jgi:hypothetical protein
MRQLFAPGADAIFRLVLLTAAALVFAVSFGLIGYAHSDYAGNVGIAPAQPVPFSHKHHVAELGLDCRNCHAQAETSATAGLPPTYTCMTCHSQIWDQALMLGPVRASLANNEPLHWTRVNRLPDYVYFNHSVHVTAGVGCSSCHGQVDAMQMTYAAKSFTMEFCLTCHRNPKEALRPQSEVWNTDWVAPANQAASGEALAKAHHVPDAGYLTQCSTCHR